MTASQEQVPFSSDNREDARPSPVGDDEHARSASPRRPGRAADPAWTPSLTDAAPRLPAASERVRAPSSLKCATMWLMAITDNPANAVIRARINPKIKEDATAVLNTIGLTVSDAMRLLMVRIAAEKRLPFAPLVPNAETIAAIEEARRGELTHVGSVEELRDHLGRNNTDEMA